MAGGSPADRPQLRVGLAAGVDRDRAARMEPAAGRDLDRVRRLAAEDLERSTRCRGSRRGTTESSAFVYGCRGLSITSPRRPLLDDPAEVHDADAIGEAGGRREVVRDHEHAQAAVAQLVEDAEDSGAHGDVEHGDRLVGDEELRLEHEARGDRDPLPLAAGELVREPIDEELGGREADLLERMVDRRAPLGARADPWMTSGSATVVATRKRGSSDSYGSW